MKPRIYFGHPVNIYGTELEKRLMEKIAAAFPGWEIVNPGEKRHQEEYRRWKEATGKGMDYYFQKVLPECSAGVFLPFRDSCWGAGIANEAEFLAKRGRFLWQITAEGVISRVNLNDIRCLTIEETIVRIRTADGKIVPY